MLKAKKVIILMISLIILIFTFSCCNVQKTSHLISEKGTTDTLQGENSDDFNFQLNFNIYGRDQIDTYKGTFTKDLVMDGTKTIKFKIPENVKKDIYNLMMDIDIMLFPDILKVEGMAVTPSCDYKLTVTIKGKTKTIVWNEGFYTDMTTNLPKDNVNFLKLVEHIRDYIYSTDEYKNMPIANGGYD